MKREESKFENKYFSSLHKQKRAKMTNICLSPCPWKAHSLTGKRGTRTISYFKRACGPRDHPSPDKPSWGAVSIHLSVAGFKGGKTGAVHRSKKRTGDRAFSENLRPNRMALVFLHLSSALALSRPLPLRPHSCTGWGFPCRAPYSLGR